MMFQKNENRRPAFSRFPKFIFKAWFLGFILASSACGSGEEAGPTDHASLQEDAKHWTMNQMESPIVLGSGQIQVTAPAEAQSQNGLEINMGYAQESDVTLLQQDVTVIKKPGTVMGNTGAQLGFGPGAVLSPPTATQHKSIQELIKIIQTKKQQNLSTVSEEAELDDKFMEFGALEPHPVVAEDAPWWEPPPSYSSSVKPCDLPLQGSYTIDGIDLNIDECSMSQWSKLNEGLDHSFYMVWRMRQTLSKILAKNDTDAAKLWGKGWTSYNEANWQMRNWFGPFNRKRALIVKSVFDKVWSVWLGTGATGNFGGHGTNYQCISNPGGKSWCETTGTSAHYFDISGPKFCPSFFEDDAVTRGSGIIHELLHRISIKDGSKSRLIVDTHIGYHCSQSIGDLNKCYSANDVMHLAKDHPGEAIYNNSNYELAVDRLARHWLNGLCTDPELCQPKDMNVVACIPEENPTYPGCDDDPGQVGCACKDVYDTIANALGEDGLVADGEGSFLESTENGLGQYCEGKDVVCGRYQQASFFHPICKKCVPGSGELGCPCENGDDCGGSLMCWGGEEQGWDLPSWNGGYATGTCLPNPNQTGGYSKLIDARWFCLDNCGTLGNFPGYPWDSGCYYDPQSMDRAQCVIHAGNIDAWECMVDNGMFFDAQHNICENECEYDDDCPTKGFPDEYGCYYGKCAPPGCNQGGNVPQQNSFCDLL